MREVEYRCNERVNDFVVESRTKMLLEEAGPLLFNESNALLLPQGTAVDSFTEQHDMSKPEKSYWLGVFVLVGKLSTAVLFLCSCFVGFRWFQAQGFTGHRTMGEFLSWVWDDTNKDQFEPLLAILALVGTPVSLATTLALDRLHRKDSDSRENLELRASELADWDRVRPKLINVVRQDWVKGHQDRNLAKRAWIHLGVEEVPDYSTMSPDIELLAEKRQEQVTGQSLIRLFDESGGRLLILGEPGSGKTVTLVKLCEALLDRAEQDLTAPVPIGLRLASWAIKRLPFEDWLAKELQTQHLGSKVILSAVESDRIILLLDGLDEVAPMARSACLAAIESYRKTRTVPLVVSCRWEDYQSLPESFTAIHALRILPLTQGQIDYYLSGFHGKLETLRHHLTIRAELRELATTPLMLSILARVYLAGGEISDLPDDASVDVWRNVVFERYVRIMFDRKGYDPSKTHVTRSKAIHYLQQIARSMRKWNLPVLYLEYLHCGWLRHKWRYLMFFVLTSALSLMLLSQIILSLAFDFGNTSYLTLSGLLIDSTINGIKFGIFTGLVFGLIRLTVPSYPLIVEVVRFRWRSLEFFAGLFAGLVCSISSSLTYRLISGKVPDVMSFSALGVAVGLVYGLLNKSVDPEPASPNQGVKASLRASIFASVVLSVIGGLIGYPFARQAYGAFCGLAMGLHMFGGLGVWDHFVTRIALASEGTLPFPTRTGQLITFLDAMCDLIVLKRVGGGWTFAHRLLLDYLADEPFGPDPKTIEARL